MRTMFLTAGLLIGLAGPAFAHEKGVIRLQSRALPVGGELVVRGEKLSKNATLRLELRGALAKLPLGDVHTDSTGAFLLRHRLPADARAGSYTVAAIAPDGDKVAQADLSITPAPAADTAAAMPGMGGHAAMRSTSSDSGLQPTAEPMKVQVETSGAEHAVMAGIIGFGLATGVGLLIRSRRSESRHA